MSAQQQPVGAELPELVAEGLDYFERSGDAGDRKYVAAIRATLAAHDQALAEARRDLDALKERLEDAAVVEIDGSGEEVRLRAAGSMLDHIVVGAQISAMHGKRVALVELPAPPEAAQQDPPQS